MDKWISLDQIKKFEIELSSYCNARCPLCIRQIRGTDIEKPDLKKNHLSFSQITKIVEQLPNPKEVIFYFGGTSGDPMMNPEIVDIFEYCSKNLKFVIMDTNASLRSQQVWKKLGEISSKYYSSINFSIDGLEDTNHLYRIRTKWNKIINNATSFISAGGHASWKYIVFKHNQHQIKEAEELSKKLGFKKFRYENSVRHYKDAGPLQPEPPDNVEKSKLKTHTSEIAVKEINCKALELKMMYISSEFKLYPCCFFHSADLINPSIELISSYANIDNCLNEKTIIEILNDNFYQSKIFEDWKKFNPLICAKSCNQIKYWKREIKETDHEKISSN